MKIKVTIVTSLIVLFIAVNISAQTEPPEKNDKRSYKNSIDFSPMSPFINIYAAHYNYKISDKDELIAGPSYMSIPFEDIGRTHAPGIIVGYRRYIVDNLHVDYQLMPMYDHFYEENEDKYYDGFDLWNEFRVGYKVEFKIADLPCYVNVQWPFGFALYAENKPQSFLDYEKEGDNRFFYKALLVFLGFEF